MAKLKTPTLPGYYYYQGVRLYREDVDDITRIISEYGGTARFSDATHEFESLDEVIQLRGEHPRSLTIGGKKGYTSLCRLKMDRGRAELTDFMEDDFRSRYEIIRSILKRRQTLVGRFAPPYWLLPVAFFAPLVIMAAPEPIALALAVALAALMVLSVIGRFFSGGIWLSHRHVGGFWRRNANSIALALFSAAVGALIKALIDWILRRGAHP